MSESTKHDTEKPVLVIAPSHGFNMADLRELFFYRELIYFFTWRDIKVRYKQTLIGILWALIQPLAMMLVFTLFFGKLAGFEKNMTIPYSVFALAGLLPWQLFARTLTESSNSLVTEQRIITKIYFPRIIVPMSSCIAALIDFVLGVILLFGLMFYYGIVPGLTILFLPFFVLLLLLMSMGTGFWLSSLNAEFRDIKYVIPFMVQFLMFLTPVIYPASIIPPKYQWIAGFNPLTGVIDGIRYSMTGVVYPGFGVLLLFSVIVALTVFVSGLFWFRYRERVFIDRLGGQ